MTKNNHFIHSSRSTEAHKGKNSITMKNVVTEIKDACTFCGACVAVCSFGSLVAKNEKISLVGKCTSCGKCLKVCPGKDFDYAHFSRQLFDCPSTKHDDNKHDNKHDASIGNYLHLFVASSSDKTILQNSSSGGVVASLMKYVLSEENLSKEKFDGVVCIRMSQKKPYLPDVFVARNAKDIFAAQGSKYCLVPTCSILKELKNVKGNFAFVGLPCQIQAVRKMQDAGMCRNITLLIGIFCGRNMHYAGTEYLLNNISIKKNDISLLRYRHGRWPGNFYVKTKHGVSKSLAKHHYDFPDLMFIPKRCMACQDYMSEFADISVGDCWIPGKVKKCSVITRTGKGDMLFRQAVVDGKIDSEQTSLAKVVSSHRHNIIYKRTAHLRAKWLRMKVSTNPCNLGCKTTKLSKLSAFAFYSITKLSQTKSFRQLAPFSILGIIAKTRRLLK